MCSAIESCRLCPSDCGPCQACGDFVCEGSETVATCPGDCSLCGDGTLQPTEECEDGNRGSGDGCSAGCRLECGDGVLGATEECDDGNRVSGDGCQSDCALPRCGDHVVDADLAEECEDGNDVDGDGCSAGCLLE